MNGGRDILASNREQNEMTESYNTVVAPSSNNDENLWAYGGRFYVEKYERRCVRGIPLSKELWIAGDGPAGEPANENTGGGGGRYPLMEEYRAKRLGKMNEESDVLWSTAKWFGAHHDIANRPHNACAYGIGRGVTAGELGDYVDREENPEARGSSDPMGYQIEIDPLYKLGGPDPSFTATTGRGEGELRQLESRARSVKICQHLKYRLDCNYRHVVEAVVHRCEMKAIGMAEGNRDGAASAGRMLVRAGLRTATLVRLDITRWEAKSELGVDHAVGPLPDKPGVYTAVMQKAANDDVRQHVRDVA
jgi:hypothetical protein